MLVFFSICTLSAIWALCSDVKLLDVLQSGKDAGQVPHSIEKVACARGYVHSLVTC